MIFYSASSNERNLATWAKRPLSVVALLGTGILSGCASVPDWVPSSGPDSQQVVEQEDVSSPIPVVDIDEPLVRRALSMEKADSFANSLPEKSPPAYLVGPGDVIEISVWETPPASLFGALAVDAQTGMNNTHGSSVFPAQTVNVDGVINVPFAGAVKVAGKTPRAIEDELVRRFTGKANQPQVLVRLILNANSNVTIVGEVAQSKLMPLTAKGERLLDAIAAAGGVKQPVEKITIQVSRGDKVLSMPLDRVIRDQTQNIFLQPADVVTAIHQPLSFTVLGAAGTNAEISFEAQGISLVQALARSGGVLDAKADATGVFIFRFEEPEVLAFGEEHPLRTPEGKIPVVYRLNLKDPSSFLVAQNFHVQDRDVLYIANAKTAQLQKFLNIITSSIYSVESLIKLAQ